MGNVLSGGCNWIMMKAMKYNGKADYPYHFTCATVNDRSPIEYARNVIMNDFLATDANRIWMIDNDMQPEGDPFKLLETEGDIVAGYFLMFNHKTATTPTMLKLCAFNRDKEGILRQVRLKADDPSVMDVDAVGSGSIIIRRKLFEDNQLLLDDSFVDLYGKDVRLSADFPSEPKPYFRRAYAPNGKVLLGADLDFCTRAKAAGYSVKLNTGVMFGQVNKINLNEIASLISAARPDGVVSERVSDADISAIHASWGNKSWAAPLPYLTAVRDYAYASKGAILECGSGATTMVINHICSIDRDRHAVTLEHEQEWYDKVVANTSKKENNHHIVKVGIANDWYDVADEELPNEIGLVICDGPPRKIGRYGLFPAIKSKLAEGYVILMEDAHKCSDVLDRWKADFGVIVTMIDPAGRGIATVTGDRIQ